MFTFREVWPVGHCYRRFEWDDLRFFLGVCRHKTVSAASQHLGVDHATASRRIARLEHALNSKLFEHRQTGFVPASFALARPIVSPPASLAHVSPPFATNRLSSGLVCFATLSGKPASDWFRVGCFLGWPYLLRCRRSLFLSKRVRASPARPVPQRERPASAPGGQGR